MKEHPELSDKFPAIDGIKTPRTEAVNDAGGRDALGRMQYVPGSKAIRSDVEEIINMDDKGFEGWYCLRMASVEKLLGYYGGLACIPNLMYGSEEQKYNMDAFSCVEDQLNAFKRAKEYLELIKEIREENR